VSGARITLVVVALAALSGCAIEKQPGRCVACCYDSCIIPLGDSTSQHELIRPEAPGPARPQTRATVVRY
jgi:hypothetical protein